ncbi:MAG: D-glycero-beta-D-manno-heptose 1-phosphate adenylyltransferase [Salinivirgaceae bacterium]|jgi:rfaE bifunctional protein nucleotidyltransferase chain/domain|nr:D-glycero-beta-D-manno-heptose 1-phosphate adenylyltransferase [Salinivirgaceae bacterium]
MTKIEIIESKIIKPDQIDRLLSLWRYKAEKIVFTNGCFDIIHLGHLKYLAEAASLGSKLVIGLNTDASVKKLKGEERPINDEFARAMVLAGFSFIDAVIFFDTDTPYELIKQIKPNYLVKGGDYKPEEIVGYDIVTQNKGEVVTINFVDGYSSTSIIKKGGLA